MTAVRRMVLSVVGVALVVVGCTSITIPSIPPIPTIPPGFTIPPIEVPSGIVLPSIQPGASTCAIVTAAEVSSTMGGTFTDQSSSPTECSFLSSNLTFPVVVTVTDGPIIDGIKFVSQGEDLTIGGNRALYANLLGDGVYVEKGGKSLTVQAIAQAGLREQLIALANIAVNRF